MRNVILNFTEQFKYKPVVINGEKLKSFKSFVVVGMGGSNLASELLKSREPELDLITHRNYGLPSLSEDELSKRLIILSSYSGNTEEVIDAFMKAKSGKLNTAVIASGGKLLTLAEKNNVPYVKLPEKLSEESERLEPRMALGLSALALTKLCGREEILEEIHSLKLDSAAFEEKGGRLAEQIGNEIPVVYASERNKGIAYVWKIALNETAKMVAFWNIFPEHNHNELAGTTNAEKFAFILLKDGGDMPEIKERMEKFEIIYKKMNFKIKSVPLSGEGFSKIFSSVMLGYWMAYHLAKLIGNDPDGVPVIEEFKRSLN